MISKLSLATSAVAAVVCIAVLAVALPGNAETEEVEYPDAPEVGEPDIVISTDMEMESFVAATLTDSMEGVTVALAADVAVGGMGGTFSGTFDGNGFTVTLCVEAMDGFRVSYLFAGMSGAVVCDVAFAGYVGAAGSLMSVVVWSFEDSLAYGVSLDVDVYSEYGVDAVFAGYALGSEFVAVSGGVLVYVSGTTSYYGCGDAPYSYGRDEMFGDADDWNMVVV